MFKNKFRADLLKKGGGEIQLTLYTGKTLTKRRSNNAMKVFRAHIIYLLIVEFQAANK